MAGGETDAPATGGGAPDAPAAPDGGPPDERVTWGSVRHHNLRAGDRLAYYGHRDDPADEGVVGTYRVGARGAGIVEPDGGGDPITIGGSTAKFHARKLDDDTASDTAAPAAMPDTPDEPDEPDTPDETDGPDGSALGNLTDGELDGELEAAGESGDVDRMTAIADEMNRRDEINGIGEDAQLDRYERLINSGVSDEEAVADAFGVPIDRQRRENAINMLRSQSYQGRSFEELARASYRDYVADLQARAEASPDVGNAVLTDAAFKAGIDMSKFFSGPDSYVRKNGSEELLRWLDENGRMTFEEWKAQLLGDAGAARSARLERIGRQDYFR